MQRIQKQFEEWVLLDWTSDVEASGSNWSTLFGSFLISLTKYWSSRMCLLANLRVATFDNLPEEFCSSSETGRTSRRESMAAFNSCILLLSLSFKVRLVSALIELAGRFGRWRVDSSRSSCGNSFDELSMRLSWSHIVMKQSWAGLKLVECIVL